VAALDRDAAAMKQFGEFTGLLAIGLVQQFLIREIVDRYSLRVRKTTPLPDYKIKTFREEGPAVEPLPLLGYRSCNGKLRFSPLEKLGNFRGRAAQEFQLKPR